MHQMASGAVDSRSMKSPAVWSICASTSTMATMALSRGARAGCRTGLACSWARISGDALTRAQESEALPFTAMEDCVRARVCIVPLRTPAQL